MMLLTMAFVTVALMWIERQRAAVPDWRRGQKPEPPDDVALITTLPVGPANKSGCLSRLASPGAAQQFADSYRVAVQRPAVFPARDGRVVQRINDQNEYRPNAVQAATGQRRVVVRRSKPNVPAP